MPKPKKTTKQKLEIRKTYIERDKIKHEARVFELNEKLTQINSELEEIK